MRKYVAPILALLCIGIIIILIHRDRTAFAPTETFSGSSVVSLSNSSILDPARITKKLFGTYVTPKNSPVQPERFTGYHTGVDFETAPAEKDKDVPIPALCDGALLMKESASGYGGVAVQSCTLNNEMVTVIYGHLRLSSISGRAGQKLHAGDMLGVLGTGYSSETDGERKHLHLGIHKGPDINILGYVQKQSDLSDWLDPTQFLK
jgi:murein DD-endopeptidase MepM/ murein hydrolase activator NlpD